MISQITATTTDCQKLRDWRTIRPYCNFQLSVVVAIAGGQFRRTGSGRKPQICPEHAPIGANSCTVLIVLDSLKIHVKLERSSFNETRDNRGSRIYNFGHVTLNIPP